MSLSAVRDTTMKLAEDASGATFVWLACCALAIAGTDPYLSVPADAASVMPALAAVTRQFSDQEAPSGFHMETGAGQVIVGDLDGVMTQCIVDVRGVKQIAVDLPFGMPFQMFLQDRSYVMTTAGKWESGTLPWQFVVDRQNVMNFLSPVDADRLPTGVTVDLKGFAEGILKGAPGVAKYHAPTLTWCLKREAESSDLYVRFRTPNDTDKLGCSLAELFVVPPPVRHGKSTGRISIRNFITKAIPQYRLPEKSLREIDVVLRPRHVDDATKGNFAPENVDQRQAATTLWKIVLTDSSKESTHVEALSRLVRSYADAVEKNDSDAEAERLRKMIPELTRLLRAVTDSFAVDAYSRRELWVDDPTIRWKRLQQAVGPDVARMIANEVTLGLMRLNWSGEEQIEIGPLELADCLGDCGRPPFMFADPGLTGGTSRGNRGYEAVLFSRWNRPTEPAHLDECVHVVDTAKGAEQAVIVETLLRMGEWKRVPNGAKFTWWKLAVVQAEDHQRRRDLQVMSLQTDGRAWMLERLTTESDASVRTAIADILMERVKATESLRRWDFIDQAECVRLNKGLSAAN